MFLHHSKGTSDSHDLRNKGKSDFVFNLAFTSMQIFLFLIFKEYEFSKLKQTLSVPSLYPSTPQMIWSMGTGLRTISTGDSRPERSLYSKVWLCLYVRQTASARVLMLLGSSAPWMTEGNWLTHSSSQLSLKRKNSEACVLHCFLGSPMGFRSSCSQWPSVIVDLLASCPFLSYFPTSVPLIPAVMSLFRLREK